MTQSRDVSSAAGFAGASMDPRPPSSSSSSSSAMASSSGRPLLGYRLTPSSASLCCSYHLLDVDVVDKSAADSEYRRQKVPHFEGERAVLSASFQAQPGQHSQSTQTVPRQQRAAITQYERQQFSHAAREVALSSDALRAFLDSAWPDVQRELSKNLTLDLFKDQMRVQDDETTTTRSSSSSSSRRPRSRSRNRAGREAAAAVRVPRTRCRCSTRSTTCCTRARTPWGGWSGILRAAAWPSPWCHSGRSTSGATTRARCRCRTSSSTTSTTSCSPTRSSRCRA